MKPEDRMKWFRELEPRCSWETFKRAVSDCQSREDVVSTLEKRGLLKALTEAQKVETLLKAVRTALFGLVPDAEANEGRVDRVAVAETLRQAVIRVEGPDARLW